ncbi:MAG: hypothetical protein JJE04_18380 [Acidobacteriia bacterium]|nr:hypothetical protein [Terriglobia bacterium]
MPAQPTRRRILASGTALAASAAQTNQPYWSISDEVIRRHDEGVERLLQSQTMDPASPWRGGVPDAFGLHNGGSPSGILIHFTAAMVQPRSRYFKSRLLMERMQLAAQFMNRKVSADGNYDLLITNFNSPPDTAFITLNLASAAFLARKQGNREIETLLEPLVRRSGAALAKGGIHTPNHRWVACAAMSQVHELYPDPRYLRRIDQWLAEGIDIDSDGQYTERSTVTYNGITNRAFTVMAIKLKRPELLDPVRRNLNSMLYLLHAGTEVVTEISRRQDQYTRGGLGNYWLALRYLALQDGNGQYETLARRHAPGLGELMEHDELTKPGPEPAPVPENYEKRFPFLAVSRIRRGLTSATIIEKGNSRFFTLRRGQAVIEAVRFASAFFGKGQFVPQNGGRRGARYELRQDLTGPYYQPLDPARTVGTEDWDQVRKLRKQTEVCHMRHSAVITERKDGFDLRVRAEGTRDVPVAIEISLREGGNLAGVQPAPQVTDGFLLPSGHATYTVGNDTIRFGPGLGEHQYTQVRGAQPKLPGQSVYLTGYAPLDHTIEFRWA